MTEWPNISNAISCRFSWVLVDEFQDTSALQVEILKLIAERRRSNFFLVGDPYQSIFGFAGARPNLMNEFAHQIKAKRDFKLLHNFRSSKPIIDHAELLFPRNPPMSAKGEKANYKENPLYIHYSTAFKAITDYFIPAIDELNIDYGQAAILAPWRVKLLHIGRQLREYGIPIVGPGARPYKRTHLFALLVEQICAYIEYPDPKVIPRIEKELFFLLNNATGKVNFKVYSYFGRTTLYRLIHLGKALRDSHEGGLIWLKAAAQGFTKILCENEFLPKAQSDLLIESVNDMEKDMIKQGVDVTNLTVNDLGMFASSERNLKLLTMHRAKGREFDAVAIVDLHEGRVPHFSAKTDKEINEAKRQLYVAITRARRILMYITDDEDIRIPPRRLLLNNGLGLVSQVSRLKAELQT